MFKLAYGIGAGLTAALALWVLYDATGGDGHLDWWECWLVGVVIAAYATFWPITLALVAAGWAYERYKRGRI